MVAITSILGEYSILCLTAKRKNNLRFSLTEFYFWMNCHWLVRVSISVRLAGWQDC